MNKMREFEEIIGYKFEKIHLLETALTHSSYANEKRKNSTCNERLEFLGDSVLSLITSRYLFENYKNLPEGELTKVRAQIVCERSLFSCAQNIELGNFIMLGKGEEMTGGRTRPSILADAFEALIAAIYLDSGLERTREWLLSQLYDTIQLSVSGRSFKDYKTMLQEKVQASGETDINYALTGQSGPDHKKVFTIEVLIGGKIYGSGEGSSKKNAEQNAAKSALERFSSRK
ncbi:MAG: ribonuclease III [Ruminococcaceae bacterium]|nr:ribonuclease III [Oscillospiraceae bacterium]